MHSNVLTKTSLSRLALVVAGLCLMASSQAWSDNLQGVVVAKYESASSQPVDRAGKTNTAIARAAQAIVLSGISNADANTWRGRVDCFYASNRSEPECAATTASVAEPAQPTVLSGVSNANINAWRGRVDCFYGESEDALGSECATTSTH